MQAQEVATRQAELTQNLSLAASKHVAMATISQSEHYQSDQQQLNVNFCSQSATCAESLIQTCLRKKFSTVTSLLLLCDIVFHVHQSRCVALGQPLFQLAPRYRDEETGESVCENEEAERVENWVRCGVLPSIDKQYLKALVFSVYAFKGQS